MVRLVVLVLCSGFFSACSSISAPKNISIDDQSAIAEQVNVPKDDGQPKDILRLDEGRHHPAVQVLLTQAADVYQQGNSKQALSYLDRARQIQPRNSEIFYRQAWLNYQLGELVQAQQLLQRAQVFSRRSQTGYAVLQHRIKMLQHKIDAKRGYE